MSHPDCPLRPLGQDCDSRAFACIRVHSRAFACIRGFLKKNTRPAVNNQSPIDLIDPERPQTVDHQGHSSSDRFLKSQALRSRQTHSVYKKTHWTALHSQTQNQILSPVPPFSTPRHLRVHSCSFMVAVATSLPSVNAARPRNSAIFHPIPRNSTRVHAKTPMISNISSNFLMEFPMETFRFRYSDPDCYGELHIFAMRRSTSLNPYA